MAVITAFVILSTLAVMFMRQVAEVTSVGEQLPLPSEQCDSPSMSDSSDLPAPSPSLSVPSFLVSDSISISPTGYCSEVASVSSNTSDLSITPDFNRFLHASSDNTLGNYCSDSSFYCSQDPSPRPALPEISNILDTSEDF